MAGALRERELPGEVHVHVLRPHDLGVEEPPRGAHERRVIEERLGAGHRLAVDRPVPAEDGATTIGRAPSSPDSAAYSAEFAK